MVSRILEQWPALQLFFNQKYLEERLLAAEQVHNGLNDPFVKLYFLFLNFVLPKVNALNQYFQSNKVLVAHLYNALKEKFMELLMYYMDPKYIRTTDLSRIDPENETYFLPNRNIYLGVEILNYLNKPEIQSNRESVAYFYERCKDFLKILCKEIKLRFDFDDPVLSQLHVFTPKNAISFEIRNQYPSLHKILKSLHRFYSNDRVQLIDDEWRSLPRYIFPDGAIDINDDIDVFWGKLFKFVNENGDAVFKNLSEFVLNVLSLPHSNAACERIFSVANAIKTKSRNRLITKTMNGILLSRECVLKSNNCIHLNVTKKMISDMTTSKLYQKNTTESSSDDEFEI